VSAVLLIALAGAVSVGAKLGALAAASRLAASARVQRLGRHLVGATTAAIGVPALVEVCRAPTTDPAAALAGTGIGLVLAVRGRSLLLVLAAAVLIYSLTGVVIAG
jgi:hypothetical protein